MPGPQHIRSLTRVIVFSLSIMLFGGCTPTKTTDPKATTQPYRGQEIELLVPKSLNLPATWEVQLQEWMTQTGAQVRWNEYAAGDEKSLAKMTIEPAPAGGRLILFQLNSLSELDRHLVSLDTGRLTDFDPKDILKGLRDRVVTRNRSLVAIPVSAPVLVCYFRADLLRAADKKPPETWEDYQALLESLESWAPGLTAVEPLAPESAATLFFARSLGYAKHPENYSVWFDLDTGAPLLDSPGFVEATDMARRAWQRMPATIDSLAPADCRREVLEGRAALAIGVEPTFNTKSSTRSPSIEIGVRSLPGSRRVFNRNSNRWEALPPSSVNAPGLCGFAGQAIGVSLPDKGSKDIAVWHLLSRLAVDQFETSWASLPKTPCRESQIGPAAAWHQTGLTVEESSQQVDAATQTLRSAQLVSDLPIPQAAQFRRATVEWIKQIRNEDIPATDAIKKLQSEFEKIVKEIGADQLRQDYRRGLGLPDTIQLADPTK